jgi:hypothetical protein
MRGHREGAMMDTAAKTETLSDHRRAGMPSPSSGVPTLRNHLRVNAVLLFSYYSAHFRKQCRAFFVI